MSPTASKTLRNSIAPILCLTFVLYAPIRLGSTAAPSSFDLKSAAQSKAEASRSLSMPRAAAVSPIAEPKSVSQLRTEAGVYEAAIREISRISTMSLSTPEQLKTANAIVAKHRQNLRYANSKLLVLGLNDLTFTNSVKASIKDESAFESFLKEVNSDPNAVLKFTGAQTLKSRFASSIDADKSLLRKVAERLKQAASDIQSKYKQHHRPSINAIGPVDNAIETALAPNIQRAVAEIANLAVIATTIVAATLVCAGCVVLFSNYVVGQLAVVGSVGVALRVFDLIVSEDSRNSLADCLNEIEALRETCHQQAAAQPFPLNLGAAAVCEADYLLRAADCLLWGY